MKLSGVLGLLSLLAVQIQQGPRITRPCQQTFCVCVDLLHTKGKASICDNPKAKVAPRIALQANTGSFEVSLHPPENR